MKIVISVLVSALLFGSAWLFFSNSPANVDKTPENPSASPRFNGATDDGAAVRQSTSSANQMDPVSPQSLEGKRDQAAINFQRDTGMSLEELHAIGEHMVAAFYNPETAGKHQAEIYAAMVDEVGREEADFNESLIASINDWEQTKQLIKERSEISGADYGEVFLKTGLVNGEISADEIESLFNRGHTLPSNAIHQLAQAGKTDTILALVERGLPIDLSYQDPVTGTNAIGAFIQNVGYFPKKYEPAKAAALLRNLIVVGVETKPQNGSFDALDFALNSVNKSNANVKLAMSKVLLEQGIPVEQSHREQLANMPDGLIKNEFLDLFVNSL